MTNPSVVLNIKNARHRIDRAKGAPYLAECLSNEGRTYDRDVPGYIWVREILSGNAQGQAYHVRATGTFIPFWGARVRVAYDEFDGEWGIIGHDFKSLVEQGINPAIVNPLNPYTRHKGTDILPVLKSFAPSNPTLPTTEISIKNYVGIDYLGDLMAFRLPDDSRPDVADYAPGTVGQKRLVHFWLDYDNTIAVSQSTPIGSSDTFDTFIDLQETFTNRPNQLARPIGVWIATNGMAETTVSDQYMDTRQFISNPAMAGFPNPVDLNYIVPAGITERVCDDITVSADLVVAGKLIVNSITTTGTGSATTTGTGSITTKPCDESPVLIEIDDTDSPYTAPTNGIDVTILANTTSGSITVNLSPVANNLNQRYSIKNVGTGTLTLDPNASETIDGQTTLVVPFQYDAPRIVCSSTEWSII